MQGYLFDNFAPGRAEIVVHGNVGNGCANAMAQGQIYVAGNIGARGMTMTKQNPRFDPPELWILGSAGDYFGEFMAGGIAVICGYEAQIPENILGYRPFVGMVGGKVFFRGPCGGCNHPRSTGGDFNRHFPVTGLTLGNPGNAAGRRRVCQVEFRHRRGEGGWRGPVRSATEPRQAIGAGGRCQCGACSGRSHFR